MLHDFASREFRDRYDVSGALNALLDKEPKRAPPCSSAAPGVTELIEIVHAHDVRAFCRQWCDVTERMNEVRLCAPELQGENSLLPAITNDSFESNEWADYTADIACRGHVEVCRATVHVDDVIIIRIRFGKRVDQRSSVRLGSSNNARNQVQEVESDEHDLAPVRCSSFRSLERRIPCLSPRLGRPPKA